MFIVLSPRTKKIRFFYCLLSLIFFILLLLTQSLGALIATILAIFYQTNLLNQKNSADARLVVYQISGKIIQNHWLFGIGANNFNHSFWIIKNFSALIRKKLSLMLTICWFSLGWKAGCLVL
ncbi:MAG: hypothetical protein GF332_02340 [Candidatus Moranbacteria bacterium]|nr:hypothetical protein [Candidatus Moranbacteria bacterium]